MRTGNYRKATLIYNGPLGDNIVFNEVGFRTRGNTTRTIPEDENGNFHRAHFKIRFNKTFELIENSEEYELRKERRFCKLRALNLKWNWNVDNSQTRELYSLDLLTRGGVFNAKTGSATLTVTIGEEKHYYGIYTIIEPVDKSFLTKRLGKDDNDGDLYKCVGSLSPFSDDNSIGVGDWKDNYFPAYDKKTNKDEDSHENFLSFIDSINILQGADFKKYIDGNFEVDRFLRYLAMNMLIGNDDDYMFGGNNYYLYFNDDKDGKIEFIPHDFDKGLGRQSDNTYQTDNFNILNLPQRNPLSYKIIQVEEYRNRYLNYIKDFIELDSNLFDADDYKRRYQKLFYLYSSYLDNDMNEGEIMNNDEVEVYIKKRLESVGEQLMEEGY